jgi:hypothetical protein
MEKKWLWIKPRSGFNKFDVPRLIDRETSRILNMFTIFHLSALKYYYL